MASEASVSDRTPDKQVEENEITTAKSIQDGAATAATEIGYNYDDNKGEKIPLVEGKNNEVVNDSQNATLFGNAIAEEKLDGHNPAEPTDQASRKPLNLLFLDTTEPVYQDTRNVVNSQLVQPVTEIGNNSDKQLDLAALKESDSSILLEAETTTDVIEKRFGELPIITIESDSESTGTVIYNCAESAPVAKLVEEPEEVSEVLDSTTAEADTLAGVQLIDKNETTKLFSGSEATSVPPELLEQVEDTTCVLASDKVGDPELFNRNSSGTSSASEISYMEKEKDMPVGVVPHSDVEERKTVDDIKHEDKINVEVVTIEDKTPETETCVSSEAVISSTVEEKWLTEERGISESSYAAILSESEAIETEDATSRTVELVNDDGEKDNVVPGSVKNAKEKDGKKVSTSDLETTAEALTKERILDLSETSNAPMVGSPDLSFENSKGPSNVYEIDHIKKEDIPIGAVSKSDVKKQTTVDDKTHKDKVSTEIGITEGKGLETETCVSSEAVICSTVEEKGFSEGREKLESSHAAMSGDSEAEATENATTKIEDLVNKNREKDDVVPGFVENTEEKTGKENSASNLETAIEVLIKERNLNPSETSNVSVVGSPEFLSENSKLTSGASDIGLMLEENIDARVVSKSEAQEQKIVDDKKHKVINGGVGVNEDKDLGTETCVSSEAVISGTVEEKWLSEGREKLESSYAAILTETEAKETENATAKLEGFILDRSEKDNVVPVSVENAKEKAGRKVSASDLETTTEVLTKERILDLSETSNATMVGSPDLSFENSNGTSNVSEIDHIQKEVDIPVEAVSDSDINEQTTVDDKNHKDKISAKVGIAEEKSLETETCASSEAVISGAVEENWLSEGREKLESGYAALLSESEAKDTENATAKIEGLRNDNSEKDNVVHEFVGNAKEKIGKENSASDLETATEVLIKESINPSETPNASMVGSPEFLSENSKVTYSASEIGHKQKENIPVRVVSASDVQEQKAVDVKKHEAINIEVGATEDKSLETDICVSAEALISDSAEEKWLSVGKEKSESSYAATASESEAKETENATIRIKGLVNDESEMENVVSESVETGQEKARKEDLASNMETAMEVLTKGGIYDLSKSSNASMVVEITKTDKVDDIPGDFEDPQDLPKMHIASGSVESAIKEVVESSDDVIAKDVKTDATEVAPITGTFKELLTETASFIAADDVGKPMDVSDSGEMVVNEEITRGNISSDVADKLSSMITREPPKDLSDGNVNVEATSCEHNANDLKKEDEQKDYTEETPGHDMAELTTETIDSTPEEKAPKQAAPSKTRSPNMISKVKHTLVKAKKAIFGKSPSSKTTSSETKSEKS